MKELERHNMTHLREQFHAHPLGQETLTLLWNSASACPEILRLSPHRTVLRCEGPRRQNWVLKIFHPKRSWERFRRVFSNYPALREYQVHQSLGLGEALTEQLTPTLGVFARPWLEEAEAEISPTTWGTGLARLHNEGWSDSDLSMDDFLFVKQKLTPLDLNHATYTSGGASISIRKRNLIQLVSQTAPEKRGPFSVALLDAYSEESCAKFPTGDVLNKATEEFRSHLWKRSARAWRDCSHFSIQSLGTKGSPVVWRRDSARPSEKWTLCEDGSSACVSQSEEMFRKDYFRFRGRLRG
ncbi:MAG: hypothetical protein QF524_02685, partial [Planctomycetota bacterium]|nr:hypothetical protein [Planctomycetota bacterium]